MSDMLFPGADDRAPRDDAGSSCARRRPRVATANRRQVLLRPTDLESLVAPDHRVRAIWAFTERLHIDALYDAIGSVEGTAGRPATDPRVLLCLWIYATIEGVGSARQLARLCEEHAAYQWICGGLTPNHHRLADFRAQTPGLIDDLLTQSVALLMAEDLVSLDCVSQDGLKVRAAAGAKSFRRKGRLELLREEAAEQVRRLRDEIDDDPGAGSRRQQAARERAAREREERVERALAQWDEVATGRGDKDPEKARVSTTDPDARVMKMGDGGYRPAFNGQLACDTKSQVVVGVGVTQAGSDFQQVEPMVDQIGERYGRRPRTVLADGGFASRESLEGTESRRVVLLAPLRRNRSKSRYAAHARWIRRMEQPEAQRIYRRRASSIECVNAQARNRGLTGVLVRGLVKVRSVLTLFALAHNVARAISLGARCAAPA